MSKKTLLFSILLVTLQIQQYSYSLKAQITDIRFEQLTIDEGLPNPGVSNILKDRLGYLWIATFNGLCRYDGYSFKTYKANHQDSMSISSNNVTCLMEDHLQNLWIGTRDGGLNKYLRTTDKFERYTNNAKDTTTLLDNNIGCIFQDKKNVLWIGSYSGLNKFDYKNKTFKRLAGNNKNPRALKGLGVYDINEDNNGEMWILTHEYGGGLSKYNKTTETFTLFLPYPDEPWNVLNRTAFKIFKDTNGFFWISTLNGLLVFDPVKEIFTRKWDTKTNNETLLVNNVSLVTEDQFNNIWIATRRGLNIYDRNKNKIYAYKNVPEIYGGLSSTNLRTIYRDKTGIIWIGTEDGGLNKYDPNRLKFKEKIPAINNHETLANRSVKSIYQDCKGNYLIGTDYGLNVCDSKLNLLETYTYCQKNKESIGVGGAVSILEDYNGTYWVGLWGGGFCKFNSKTGRFIRYKSCDISSGLRDDCSGCECVMSIGRDETGHIWLGTMNGYLDDFNPVTEKFEHHYLGFEWLNNIVMDNEQKKIWLISQGGLLKFDRVSKKVKRYCQANSGISNDQITSFTKDQYGNFWIATSFGLNYFDTKKETFKIYTTKHGLESNKILSVQVDNDGNAWGSTEKILWKFDISKQRFFNYTKQEGVKNNAGYSYKDQNGQLFFGGVNGLNIFYPQEITSNENIPNVFVTNFKLFNKQVEFGDNLILSQTINTVKEIRLSYKQSIITFEYAALNFTLPEKNQYAYKMEGFDQEWQYVGDKKDVTYTNLNPGKYTFHVKACNNDGLWNEKGTSIQIIISPPFYKTLWFKLLLTFTILALIYLYIKIRTHRLLMAERKLVKLVKKRTQELFVSNEKLQKHEKELIQMNLEVNHQKKFLLMQNQELESQKKQITQQNTEITQQNTEIQIQKEKVQKIADELYQSNQMRIRFFINITHEFRTALTLILNPIETLLTNLDKKNEIYKTVSLINKNAQRMFFLVNQLIDIRKLETQNLKLSLRKDNLASFLESIFHAFDSLAEKQKIAYQFLCSKKSLHVWFDFEKIEKIVFNLLSNAFKFTTNGGTVTFCVDIRTRIEIETDYKNETIYSLEQNPNHTNFIEIKVEDTGIGIEPQFIDHIFEQFYQVEGAHFRTQGGTGIGLNLVKELVELHHGSVFVKSELQKGTYFYVILPCMRKAPEHLKKLDAEINPIITISSLIDNDTEYEILDIEDNDDLYNNNHLPLLMIVEDNKELQKLIKTELSKDFRIKQAYEGVDALEKIEKNMPDIICSDIMMPKMSGLDLCKKIKSHDYFNTIPFILLTSLTDTESQLDAYKSGADDYLQKPFPLKVLTAKLKNILETRKQLKEQFKTNPTLDNFENIGHNTDIKFLQSAIEIVEKHIADVDFDSSALAKEMLKSRAGLYTKLKVLTNQSVNEFIKVIRLKKAADLIIQNKYSISGIAYMTGFASSSYFTKCFREYFGKTPSEHLDNS